VAQTCWVVKLFVKKNMIGYASICMKIKKDSKIVVAMSGGVDSSVVAAILKKKGYQVTGVYLQFWTDPKTDKKMAENKCCSRESMERAQRIARKLQIPVCVLDVGEKFKEKVVDYFLDEHKEAKTPNPCIECNKNIKFGALLNWAKSMGADFIATGHYAQMKQKKGIYELHKSKDKEKDQSYFLYKLTQDQLKHVLFPIGHYTKKKVRKLAKKYGVVEAEKSKESQGVCFFPEKEPSEFLKRHLNQKHFKPGPIKTVEGGIIGEHEGLPLYTIGQRKGIKIGGTKNPLYVVGIDPKANTLIVGDNKHTFKKTLQIKDLVFQAGKPKKEKICVAAKIRHRFPDSSAILEINGEKGTLTFKKEQRAVTKGQSAVFYKGSKILGGGEIVD